jgi:soluble lytic murein transglycosylase-like protein
VKTSIETRLRSRAVRFCGLFAGLVCLSLWASPAASGGLYSYIDDRGVIHFSDTPYDGRYRKVALKPRQLALSPLPSGKAPIEHLFDALIARTARDFEVEPALVKAVVAAESNFQIRAVSRVGALGLMQLMPATAAQMGVREPFRPSENLRGGTRYLRAMLDRYGDVRRALAAYNAGPTAVDRYEGIPPYRETKAYVKRVLNYYRDYQGQFPKPAPLRD